MLYTKRLGKCHDLLELTMETWYTEPVRVLSIGYVFDDFHNK